MKGGKNEMKKINNLLIGGAIVLSSLISSCAPMSKTYKPAEVLGEVKYSIKWTNPKRTFVEADSASFIVKGHPKVQPGDLCFRGYKKNLALKEGIEYTKEYKLVGRKRAF